MEIISIFEVTNYKTGHREQVRVEGAGQKTVDALFKSYPRFTKFVLEGFEIDGEYVNTAIND